MEVLPIIAGSVQSPTQSTVATQGTVVTQTTTQPAPTTTQPAANPQIVQIDARQLNGQPTSVSVGDIVQLAIRQNNPGELGLIALAGTSVRATLPQTLAAGDRVRAQIIQSGEQIILRLLDEVTAENALSPAIARLLAPLAQEFQNIIQTTSATTLRQIQAEDLNSLFQRSQVFRGTIERLLDNLIKGLPAGERLFTPGEILDGLIKASEGGQTRLLRDLSISVQQLVKDKTPDVPFINARHVQAEVLKLLTDSANSNFQAAGNLTTFIGTLERTLTTLPRDTPRPEIEPLTIALQNLRLINLPEDESAAIKPPLRPILEMIFSNLDAQILRAASTVGAIDQRTIAELTQLASHLDSLANAQEALDKLNPMLQALGEPALILFPFLFQGLFSHTEVAVHTKAKRKKQGLGEEEGRGDGQSTEGYRRIQLTAPLPGLGNVGVDVAIRSNEIFVRMTVANNAQGQFLEGKVEELMALLREQGYGNANISTAVGDVSEALPIPTLNASSHVVA